MSDKANHSKYSMFQELKEAVEGYMRREGVYPRLYVSPMIWESLLSLDIHGIIEHTRMFNGAKVHPVEEDSHHLNGHGYTTK